MGKAGNEREEGCSRQLSLKRRQPGRRSDFQRLRAAERRPRRSACEWLEGELEPSAQFITLETRDILLSGHIA